MWLQSLIDSWMDYATHTVAVIIAIIGILAKTQYENKPWPINITRFGWILVILAIVNLSFSLHRTYESNRNNENARYWALLEIEAAIYKIITPYIYITDKPEIEDRFLLVRQLNEAEVFGSICSVNLHKPASAIFTLQGGQTWGQVLTENTELGANKLKNLISVYSSILPPELVSQIGEVIIHPWIEFIGDSRKRELRHISRRQLNIIENGVPVCSKNQKLVIKYKKLASQFGSVLTILEESIGTRIIVLSERMGRNDPAPLFLRQISGLIYLPVTHSPNKAN